MIHPIFWYIGLLSVFIAFSGLVFLRIALVKLHGNFKEGMVLLLISATFAVASSLTMAVLSLMNISITHVAWNIVPVFFTFATFFFLLSTRTLERVFKVAVMEVEGKESKVNPYDRSN